MTGLGDPLTFRDSIFASSLLHEGERETSLRAGFIVEEDSDLGWTILANDGSDPPPEDADPIIVTGKRPKTYDPGIGGDPGTKGPGDGGDGGGIGGGEESGSDDPPDCRDRGALSAQDELNREPDKNTHENGKIIYRDANGQIQVSGTIQGTRLGIPQAAWEAEMARLGIDRSQVVGIPQSSSIRILRLPRSAAVPIRRRCSRWRLGCSRLVCRRRRRRFGRIRLCPVRDRYSWRHA